MASVLWMSHAALGGVPLISNDAFVSVSVSSKKAELPDATPMGTYSGQTSLELFVASNSPYQVSVGFQGFVSKKGLAIGLSDTKLTINRVPVPVGRGTVPVWAADRTASKGVAIPLAMEFQLSNMNRYPAGAYSGEFAIAVATAR
jgi:hypothetical protein